MKIHITLLGQETLPLYYLVKTFPQDVVYVLCTAQNKSESKNFQQILTEFVKCNIVEVDAYDAKSVFNACENIHNQYGIDSEYSYNLTGGTKIMALAAYSIALKHNAKIFYTDSKQCISLPSFEADTLKCSVDTKTLIRLQGQILQSYVDYTVDADLVSCARQIERFVSTHAKVYKTLSTYYRANNVIKSETSLGSGNNSFIYKEVNGHILISQGDKIMLDIDNPKSKSLLFEGRWWETLVADAVNIWSRGRFIIWQNVCFDPRNQLKDKEITKNEVDILVNVGNTLLFVECKSGIVSQENIYTMSSIRKTYGSAKAKSVLVSYHKIPDAIIEKANDAQIDVLMPKMRGQTTDLNNLPSRFGQFVQALKL